MNPIELHRQYQELGANVAITSTRDTCNHVFQVKPDDYTGNLPFLKATAKVCLTKPYPKYDIRGGGRCCSMAYLIYPRFTKEESK